jgi:cytochrome c553
MDPANPLQMAASVVPYEVNSPLWSDGALKTRGMKIPAGKKIHVKDCVKNAEECKVVDPYSYPSFLPPYDDGKWVFPIGTVMVKNFMFGDTSAKSGMKFVETRLFVRLADDTWMGYGYQWNDAQTEATIVADPMTDPTVQIPSDFVGAQAMFSVMTAAGKKTITWNYPSRAACMKCHVKTENSLPNPHIVTGGYTLGPETSQMNRMVLAANGVDKINQIDKLKALNLFEVPPAMPYKAALVAPYAGQAGTPPANATLDQRARSYLHANCSFCHRPESSFYYMDLRDDVPFKSTYICNVKAEKGGLSAGMDAPRVAPGDPMMSVMWLRMNALPDSFDGTERHGRMPQLASYVVDADATKLISDWIKQIPLNCGGP